MADSFRKAPIGVPSPAGGLKRRPLDVTSRLMAKSLLAGPLTETATSRHGLTGGPHLSVTGARAVAFAASASSRDVHNTTTSCTYTNPVLASRDALSGLLAPETFIPRRRAVLPDGSVLDDSEPLPPQTTFLESLEMSEAAVATLARGGFINLVRVAPGQATSPYALVIADVAHVGKGVEYFTLSANGVTLIPANGEPGVSTPLAEWSREFRLYSAMLEIPFFARFRMWKAWRGWRMSISGAKRSTASAALATGLFILNDTLRVALSKLRAECEGIATAPLFVIDRAVTLSLSDFVAAQETAREVVATRVATFGVGVRDIVRDAANDVLDAFLVARRIQPGARLTFTERSGLRAVCLSLTKFIRLADFQVRDALLSLALEGVSKVADAFVPSPSASLPPLPIVFTCQNDASAAANIAVAAAEADKVAAHMPGEIEKFFTPRLTVAVDFAVSAPLPRVRAKLAAALAAGGANAASNEEEKKGDEAEGAAAPDPTPALVFSPTQAAVRTALRDVLADAMQTIGGVERMLTHEEMTPFVTAAMDEVGSAGVPEDDDESEHEGGLAGLALQHSVFKAQSARLLSGVEATFAAVEEFASVFLPFGRTFLRNEAAMGANKPQPAPAAAIGGDAAGTGGESAYTGTSTHEALEAAITLYKSQVSEFDACPFSTDVGVARLDSSALKGRLTPSPMKVLAAIEVLIPQLLHSLTSRLIDEISGMGKILSGNPSEVEPFVLKCAALEASVEGLPDFRERKMYIASLAALMTDNEWTISEDLKALFRVLANALSDLENAASKTEASLEADSAKFIKKVEDAIPVLRKDIYSLQERLTDETISQADAPPAKVLKLLKDAAARMEELKGLTVRYASYQTQLRQPVTELEVVDEVAADMNVKIKLWEAISHFGAQIVSWRETPFASIDADDLGRQVQGYFKTAVRSEKMLPGSGAAGALRASIDNFKGLLPVVADLRNKTLLPRHWKEIEAVLGCTIDPKKEYTLGELLALGVVEQQPAISTISTKAVQESALLDLFQKKVTLIWSTLDFTVNSYKDSKEVFVLGAVDEVIAALDESLVNINTILGSRFCAPIRVEVEGYQKRLMLVSETLDEWLNCQKQWMYLESIFSADDIKRQLPEESKKFANVDRSWRTIMKRTNGNPNAVVAGTVKGLKETFLKHNEVLDGIQKALEDYLEKKRSAFPRFYFLSNEELLEILAQTRDPQAVQPHLRKCFDALTLLEFGKEPGSVDILAMISPERERVELTKNLKARGNVEDWLTEVQKAMMVSLNRVMREGLLDYSKRSRKDWVKLHPAQVVATVAQIAWCRETEEALRDPEDPLGKIADWYEKNVLQLRDLTALVRSNLTKLERATIVALVTTDVHARDIIETLRDESITTAGNFLWQQQLRYYWADDTVKVQQSNSFVPYGYEYMGATTRLVITPLTDRCWMTITGAYNLKLGAAPAGPAGTGKTESSKDLAKALGIQCIVFNCSDQIDYKMMGKLFSGLAQSSSWTCLDEFNRIDIEVLSVVAQQVQQLRQGIIQGLTEMVFEGRTIKLKPHMVIITMNPGYAGRTELPDNLKVLFRGVSMMVPDYALIAEISLFSEGFDDSKNLSRKMVKLYKLASEQLSQQRHYDFGMRAVKSVLVMAGQGKRSAPDLTEDAVLIRAMRDSNVPKFLVQDLPLFAAIVSDLFPGVHVPFNDSGALQSEILGQLGSANLQVVPAYTLKILQLYEIFQVRFGAVLTGQTMSGKTTAYSTLAKSLSALSAAGHKDENFQQVHFTVLNPKCITMGELYGEFNPLSQEWTDGLASTIIRGFVNDMKVGSEPQVKLGADDKKWCVFDGPIDALWIENMNTVLDDNMTLCLANGERIKLKTSMKMLFEVGDLDAASPATVSRLGVVFLTPGDLGWRPFVTSWIAAEMPASMSPELRTRVAELFATTVDRGIAFRKANCFEPIVTTEIQTGASLARLFTALLRTVGARSAETGLPPGIDFAARSDEENTRIVDMFFGFAYVWCIGGSIDSEGYEKFDSFMHTGLKGTPLDKLRWGPGTVWDAFPDIAHPEIPWRKWSDIVPGFVYDKAQPYFSMVVPTIDTVRFNFLLETQLSQLFPVFFTGVTGTSKTVIVQDMLNRTSSPEFIYGPITVPIVINFSARTKALDTQASVEIKLEKKKKTQLGAPSGKRIIIFVDDVNMPAVETYGAQPPIELMRQYADQRGFYDRQKLFWKEIVDSVIVGASAPPSGGRAVVTTRFTRHFHMLCLPPASDDVLKSIFGAIFSGWASGMGDDIKSLTSRIVASTTEVFNRVRDTMRPTPSKSHYTFNLRDVSKVFQGVLMIGTKELGGSAEIATRLWSHECMRVFHDRLIDAKDKGTFTLLLEELLKRIWSKSGAGWAHADLFEAKPLLFVDFLKSSEDGPGPYEESTDMKRVINLLDNALEDFNLTNPTQMKLVFFRDAVEHVTRVKRILRQPRGNAMLVGVGGSGKQSVTRIACHMSGMQLFQIELVRGYRLTEFREDLKKIMIKTGVEGKSLAFVFGDTQIVDEAFLEDISSILNTGEVPGMFPSDEMNAIVENLRPIALNAGLSDTRDNLARLFVQRVRDNLHIILTMSPVGSALRVRCRQFPSLINCCTIDWFTAWPADALQSVATRFLGDEELGSPEENLALCDMCVEIHTNVSSFSDKFFAELQRRVYTTPKSYLDLINLYLSMLKEKREQFDDLRTTLAVGSRKLNETNAMVAGLKIVLATQQPLIAQKTIEAGELLIQVKADKEVADVIKARVESEALVVSVVAAEVKIVADDAQRDLDVALPALEKAEKALEKLDKKDINEVKAFPKPPAAVMTVMEAVCLLLGEKMDWDTAKAVLGRGTFMSELLNYDKGNVSPGILKKLQRYISDPTMEVEAVGRVSSAAKTLAIWVHAVDIYSRVAKEVEPKKQKLAAMNAKLDVANSELKEKQDALQAVLDKVASLVKQADETTAEKNRLVYEGQLTSDRLERAEMLTGGLASEGVRWEATVKTYDRQITALVGDVLLSAACISYFGAFTGTYRTEMVANWVKGTRDRGIPASDNPSLFGTMGDPVAAREWMMFGLPSDAVSMDNAILVTRGKRWPLMIDPQEQAKKWIKNMEARQKLAVTRLTNPNMLRTLESCMRIGLPLLIEDVGETLDPALEPVLQKAIFKQGGRTLIHLGDSDVDYDSAFRLYITTKLPNPHYLPEVCIKVTVINFTVTMFGLVDQLLGAVVRKERPDVERKKSDLIVSMSKDKKALKDLEDKILRLLRASEGNILDDKVLISTLAESKELSAAIAERLAESEATEVEINVMREGYRPAAIRGSLIYFVIADLAQIDPMYQFSLAYFVALYNRVIDLADKSPDLTTRLSNLKEYLTAASYANVCRGLFEAHKLIFSFLMCTSIMREAGGIGEVEWLLLLRGGGSTIATSPSPFNPQISTPSWNFVAALEEQLPNAFSGLAAHIASPDSRDAWKTWLECAEPHTTPLPAPWAANLTPFSTMLILKALREEKTVYAVKDFVSSNLGPTFVQSPPVSLAEVMKDAREDTPVIFILSTGADPTGMLFAYAKTQNYLARLKIISLGQGQGPVAKALIEASSASGDWVLLQNCHLAKSWMPALEKIVDELGERRAIGAGETPSSDSTAGPISPDFRLFLTSMPAPYFPVPVLQTGLKLTNEPPKGIRANLVRTFAQIDNLVPWESCDGAFDDGASKMHVWKKLCFSMSFFHAVVQERRKFGPLGFNVKYEFNDSDLETSLLVLKMLLSEQPVIPWDAIRYSAGVLAYGGRVTDALDLRCVTAIMLRYICPDVLAETYKFSPSGTYFAPPSGKVDVVKVYAMGLPLNDNPEIFGLHLNANIASQRTETNNLIETVLSLQPRSSGTGGGRTPDETVADICRTIEAALPPLLNVDDAHVTTFQRKGEHMDSLGIVLMQEMERFNFLLVGMRTSLVDLQRAIRGEVLLSEELDKMFQAMINNKVPDNWTTLAYPSLKPLASWVKDAWERLRLMRAWLVGGQPQAFWISGFFFPQGFLTGVLQNFARKYAIAIDQLNFGFTIRDELSPADITVENVPADGVLVYGLFFDGARWDLDNKLVMESRPGEINSSLPMIHFIPVKDYKPDPTEYSAPCYKTSTRAGTLSTTGMSTNYVISVELPTAEAPAKWILAGAALLCQLND